MGTHTLCDACEEMLIVRKEEMARSRDRDLGDSH